MSAAIALWICACVYLSCGGWLLSALYQLNAAGYAVALSAGLAAFFFWRKKFSGPAIRPPARRKLCQRFRRVFPALFLLAAVLVFLGGALGAPNNYDALTYRLPRMLNWLAAGHWLWIPTFNDRMNYSGVAWEWTAMPFLALLHSDRGLFLINALGFLLLPGLLFSIFRQVGVARKVAWTWMWLVPLAYGYVTQAGSIGNDLTGTLFCLASIHFGLRARRSGRVGDVWLALLAAALLTGAKLSNLPLALPCLVAIWPALGQLRKHLAGSVAVVGVAVVVSAAPMMVLNQLHAGSWNGDPHNEGKMQLHNPAAAFIGNSFLLAEQCLAPPVLPGSDQLNKRATAALPDFVKENFPRLSINRVVELPGEEGSGLGLGLTLPLLLALGASASGLGCPGRLGKIFSRLPPVAIAAWISMLVYLAKMGSEAGPRLLLPYYPLVLIPLLLLPAHGHLLRRRGWRIFLVLTMLGVLPVLILSMARPLWPAQTVTTHLAQSHPGSKILQRLATTYTAYAHRNDILAPLRPVLAGANEIGFIAGSNDADYSLWRPFGSRKIIYLRHDLRPFLENPDVEWVVVKRGIWPEVNAVPLEEWAQAHHAKIVLTVAIVELVSWGPEDWCVLHLEKPAGLKAATP